MEKKTILAVGLTDRLIQDLAVELNPARITIRTAPDAHTGFTLFCAEPIDLVVSDAHVGGDSSFEFMARVKAFAPDKPVVLIVEDDKNADPQDIYDMGANAVIKKPVSFEYLARTINILFNKGGEHWSARPIRYKAELPIELEFLTNGTYIITVTTNIGRGGLFVKLDPRQVPPEHSLVSFKIVAKKPHRMNVKGEAIVRWTRKEKSKLPSGIGIEFIVLEDDSRDQVIELTEILKRKIT